MTPPEALPNPGTCPGPLPGAPSSACDADPRCGHAACFQVELEASRPERAYRQALACAYHVADVIEALHGWAREHDLACGQLTVLAIEPAADGRQAGGTSGPKTAALREFAFTTIPLRTISPGPAPRREPPGPAPRREPPGPAPRREPPGPAPRRDPAS